MVRQTIVSFVPMPTVFFNKSGDEIAVYLINDQDIEDTTVRVKFLSFFMITVFRALLTVTFLFL